MKRVFLDNNTYINAFEKKKEPTCSKVSEILLPPDVELVLSEELLVEFAQTDNPAIAEHLLNSALQNRCVWIESFEQIQRKEVGNYVRSSLLKLEVQPIKPFAERYHLLPDSHPNVQPIDFLRACMAQRHRDGIAAGHSEHANILKQLQIATKQGLFTPDRDEQALFSLIRSRIPEEVMLQAERIGFSFKDVVEHCLNNREVMYESCPSMNTERHLSDYRASDPTRRTRSSDSKDLTMSVAVLPYVDEFVSGDGYLHGGLKYVQRKIPAITTSIFKY